MDIDEAFAHLKLPLDATEQKIRSAYRRLSKGSHPDSPSGDKEAQTLINQARDTALAYTKIRGAVVPISPASLTNKIRSAIATYNREPSNETARNLFKQKTNHLNTIKWMIWVIGALVGIVAFTESNIETFKIVIGLNSKELKTILGMFSSMLVGVGFVLQFIIKSMEGRLERFLSKISNKVECARQLAEKLDYKDIGTVSEVKFSQEIMQDFPTFPILIPINYSSILLQKSVEHDLLAPLEADEITPGFRQAYSLKFKPSLFRPAPPPPPKPRSLSEVRSDLAITLGITGFFGSISIGLIYFGFGWWALIPVLLTFFGIIGSVIELTEFRKHRRHEGA